MNIDKYETIQVLRIAIRSQVALSREKRAEINTLRAEGPSTGQTRCNLNVRRKAIGSDTRDLLLALAFVRGRTYATVERKTDCAPYAGNVIDAVMVHTRWREAPTAEEKAAHCDALETAMVAWLKREETTPAVVSVPCEAVAA